MMRRIAVSAFFICIQITYLFSQPIKKQLPELVLLKDNLIPVITVKNRGSEDNKYGFEGGTAVKVGNTYHLFTSEMFADPFWVKMRFGHWTSTNKIDWTREGTIFESSGDFTGKDPRASLWSPMVVWDEEHGYWNLFYVAYYSEPNADNQFKMDHSGRIYRATSKYKGIEGIRGPYMDIGIIMQPEKDSETWEGFQGIDSFYPWKVGDNWLAFYGSAQTEKKDGNKLVGFAKSKALDRSWEKLTNMNPSKLDDQFIENPIVTKLPERGWICIYDCSTPYAIGWAYSSDGINWDKGQPLVVQATNGWAKDVRTPMGLIYEGNNRFTLFYSGFETLYDWPRIMNNETPDGVTCAIGFVELELKTK